MNITHARDIPRTPRRASPAAGRERTVVVVTVAVTAFVSRVNLIYYDTN